MKNDKMLDYGLRIAVAAILCLFVALVVQAEPPDNRPPDNRPPGQGAPDVIEQTVGQEAVQEAIQNVSQEAFQESFQENIQSQTVGDTTVNGGAVNASPSYKSETLALGLNNQLGGVEIGDCIASSQFGTPLFSRQDFKLNPWCAAETFDAKGMHKAAARLRCTIKAIRSLYEDNETCIQENTYSPEPTPVTEVIIHEKDELLEDELNVVQAKLDAALLQIAAVEEATKRKPRPVTTTVRQVEQVEFLSDKKRALLEELKSQ